PPLFPYTPLFRSGPTPLPDGAVRRRPGPLRTRHPAGAPGEAVARGRHVTAGAGGPAHRPGPDAAGRRRTGRPTLPPGGGRTLCRRGGAAERAAGRAGRSAPVGPAAAEGPVRRLPARRRRRPVGAGAGGGGPAPRHG